MNNTTLKTEDAVAVGSGDWLGVMVNFTIEHFKYKVIYDNNRNDGKLPQ
jgi:hypothetical protein